MTEPRDPMRVLIGMPTHDQVMADTAFCLAALTAYEARRRTDDLVLQMRKGTVLADMRNTIVEEALARRATHILWVDSDMIFPKEGLERLLAARAPTVGCNYVTRLRPVEPTAVGLDGNRIYETDQSGLERVLTLGLGFALVETDVFRAMPFPWFNADFRIGEDSYFFLNANQPVLLDHDLSRLIRHVGYHQFSWADAGRDREWQ